MLVITVLVSSLMTSGCGRDSDEPEASGETLTVEVQRGTLLTTVSAFGSISMPNQAELTFGSSGTVSEVHVTFGDTVKKGQVMAKLDTTSLERAVTQAEASLRTAQINLERIMEASSAAEIAQAEAAVESAEATLVSAEDALEEARKPHSATDIAQAEAAVESARANLVSAEESLKDAQSPFSDLSIANAEAAVRDAQVALENAYRSLTVAEKNAAISIKDAQDQADNAYDIWYDYVWDNFHKLTDFDIAKQKDALWWNVEKARENLEIAESQATSSKATAENNVTKAKEALKNAEDALAEMTVDPVAVQQKESTVATARAALTKAEEDLAEMKAEADPVLIQQKESAVATAKAALAKAEENLAEIKTGVDPTDIELKQIQVDNALIARDEALENLEDAVMTAPFDGVVADEVQVDIGDSVTANTGVILLLDTTKVGIDATVDEIDVAKVQAGQMGSITLDAIPESMLMGQVTAVSPVARMESGVVTYKIALDVQNPQGVEVKEGMTASIEIVVLREDNVLLVPSQAITRSGRNRVVQVVIGEGKTEERIVETGSSDAMRTEIISGLEEGEKILVQAGGNFAELMNRFPGGGMRIPGMGGVGGGPPR